MSAEDRLLRIELRYRLGLSSESWATILETLVAWEPLLRPQRLDRLSDTDALEQEVWSDWRWQDLSRRLGSAGEVSWLLSRLDDERVGLMASRTKTEVELSLGVRPTAAGPSGQLKSLLAALAKVALPAGPSLAMACEGASPDAEIVMQGLRGLKQAPPLLYLDTQAAGHAGGSDRLLNAPCETEPAPGGVLLVVRPSFWWPPSPQEEDGTAAVARYLGIEDHAPLVLLP